MLLDLYCGQGGAAMGYHRAGFYVVGVDINPQPHYPFRLFQRDALYFLKYHGRHFDAIHASPPCQAKTKAQRIRGYDHPKLIGPTRDLLLGLGKPYVIENVPPDDPGMDPDPLIDPVMLCGAMFPELNVYRHREFETSFPLHVPAHPAHLERQTKMGRPPVAGERMQVVGNFSGVAQAREAMGIDWMTRDGLREAIPPAYTEFVGEQLLAAVNERQAA